MKRILPLATVVLVIATLAGCGAPADGEAALGGRVHVVTSFYPLTYVVENVGGELVSIDDLTPSGGEAHNLELSPSQVAQIGKADVAVYVGGGFQPSVEQAISVQDANATDVMQAVTSDQLLLGDSHIWLNPLIMAQIGEQVAEALAEADPAHVDTFTANAEAFTQKMAALNDQFAITLEKCAGATLVTSHEAFGYLAAAYGLEQMGITGINPEAEPSPKRLREVSATIADKDVTTLFFEKSAAAQTEAKLADSLGVATAQLDPMEGVPAEGRDYQQVMETNLQALSAGLNCRG